MKKLIISLFTFWIIITNYTFSQGIIIDHTCADISQIPADVIDDIQENIKWHYAHTSHGRQLICGMDSLESIDLSFDIEVGYMELPEVSDALCIFDGQEDYTYIAPEGYWSTEVGMEWTQNVLNNNPTINVSQWSWCAQCGSFTFEQIQAYLDSISYLESMFPDVTFVYMTGNAQNTGADGHHRHQVNNMIRQFCIDNNKVLFDFADLDVWYNGEMNYYIYDNDTVPVEHPAYYGDVCGHVNEILSMQKGKATWYMMARIRGWQSENNISLNLKVYLEGSFNVTNMNTSLKDNNLLPLAQPYNIYPWYYPGNESVIEFPLNSIVDWVLIEIRDAPDAASATQSAKIDWQAAFLLENGNIVSLEGLSLQFENNINNHLFVVVWHRNHLGVMSAYPASESGGEYSYDFTDDLHKTYGGYLGCKQISLGVYGMISSDGDSNGEISIDDKINIWSLQAGKRGYYTGDFDLDGEITNGDKAKLWGPNIGFECQVPE